MELVPNIPGTVSDFIIRRYVTSVRSAHSSYTREHGHSSPEMSILAWVITQEGFIVYNYHESSTYSHCNEFLFRHYSLSHLHLKQRSRDWTLSLPSGKKPTQLGQNDRASSHLCTYCSLQIIVLNKNRMVDNVQKTIIVLIHHHHKPLNVTYVLIRCIYALTMIIPTGISHDDYNGPP